MAPTSLRRLAGSALTGTLVLAALTVAPPARAADAVDGALTSGDSLFPNQGNGGYDVSHYDVDLSWDPDGTIEATTTITATTTTGEDDLRSFGLDLEGPGLEVSSVTVDDAPAAEFRRIEEPDQGTTVGAHKLVVTPATPVHAEFTVVVSYAGTPSTRHDTAGSDEGWMPTADGATFLGQPIGSMTGFPNNNTPSDKATYTFRIDVPEDREVASNGEPESTDPEAHDGRRTWVWHQDEQMASELAMVSIGQYDVDERTVTLSDGRQIPSISFIDATLPQSDTLAEIGTVQEELQGLEGLYGPYPGNSTGVVVDALDVGYALETQDRPFFAYGIGHETLVHELTHLWWGDAVSPGDWNGLWVNEGMATWAPVRLARGASGVESAFYSEWNSTSASSSLWDTPPSGMDDPDEMFGWQSYDRGAMTYEALRTAIGDAAFTTLTQRYQDTYNGQSPRWTDLIAMAEQVSGHDLTAFFEDWVYDDDKPAWPGRFDLALAASPAGAVVPGSTVTYSLFAKNTGKVTLDGAQVAVDLADVLDDATLGALPPGVTRSGTTLTWSVPSTPRGSTAAVAVPVTVGPAAGGALAATAAAVSLGGTCVGCATSQPVRAADASGCRVDLRGKARVGKRLRTVVTGCPAGTALTYRWTVRGKRLAAHGPTLRLRPAYAGARVRVEVTATVGTSSAVRTDRSAKVRPRRR